MDADTLSRMIHLEEQVEKYADENAKLAGESEWAHGLLSRLVEDNTIYGVESVKDVYRRWKRTGERS